MSTELPKRYSPLWVSLHWAIALLIFGVYALGLSTLVVPPAARLAVLRWHMPLGATVLALMAVRIIVRIRTPRPEAASAGNPLLDRIGVLTHYLLYVLAILMPLSGMALSVTYGLFPIDLGIDATALYRVTPILHRLSAIGLGLLIALHIGAAFYHQLIRKDNLLSRMWYGS